MQKTEIGQRENGSWFLINGNAESAESWEDYEDAKQAMINDDRLQEEADKKGCEDIYYENSTITWIA